MGWTLQDLERLNLKEVKPGVYRKDTSVKHTEPKRKVAKSKSKAFYTMLAELDSLKIPFELEHRFDPNRKFRFDFAFIEQKIAIEYEGLMSKKSRHTTVTGYSKDADKYNLAQKQGWKIFRFTTLNYNTMLTTIKPVLGITE